MPPTSAFSSVPPISVHQCSLSVPITAFRSVPPNGSDQCHLPVPYMSAAFQCPPVMPVNAHQ
ncbi:unnamed protein product [Staurois parvus]|uniref:Uncharacterized protein n=1 Tax=Staurois parvus TaxID=386267 RepID=A0ABN9ESA3_9NEOB|nr:unnamed protein product [Staurois parvus]